MFSDFASWVLFDALGLDPTVHWAQALHFFLYDSLKIVALLFAMIFAMGILNSYIPVERIRVWLRSRRWYGLDHLLGATFGAITPFCSCSSIPLFIGFIRGGIPLGVTFSFLITSPLVNEAAIAVFVGVFGWKVTAIYVGSGIAMGTIVGGILGRMRLERFVEPWVWEVEVGSGDGADDPASGRTSLRQRLPGITREALATVRRVLPYVLIGVAVGALLHGFVPANYFEQYISRDNPFAVPVAVLIGVPMYANATSVIPIVEQLVDKGIPLGTALAFMMAVVGLSVPEALLLRRVLTPRLLAIFFGSVSLAIMLLGYLFNAVLASP
jgi:uncharacterized membrane protein YraQ (UPF0718 family)